MDQDRASARDGAELKIYPFVLVCASVVAIVAKLNAEIVRILKLPEVGERLAAEGAELSGNTPEEFAAYIKSEQAKWAKVVKISGARVH